MNLPHRLIFTLVLFWIWPHQARADVLPANRTGTASSRVIARAVPALRFQILPSENSKSTFISVTSHANVSHVTVSASIDSDVVVRDPRSGDLYFGHFLSMALFSTQQGAKSILVRARSLDDSDHNFVALTQSHLHPESIIALDHPFQTLASVPSNSILCGKNFPEGDTGKGFSCDSGILHTALDITQFVKKSRTTPRISVQGRVEYLAIAE